MRRLLMAGLCCAALAGCGGEPQYEDGQVLEAFADAGIALKAATGNEGNTAFAIYQPDLDQDQDATLAREYGVFSVYVYDDALKPEDAFAGYRDVGGGVYVLEEGEQTAVSKQYGANVQLDWRECCEDDIESSPDNPKFERLDRILASLGDE